MAKEKFTASIDSNYPSTEKSVTVINRCNRVIEVIVKGKTVRFDPYERKTMDEADASTDDFKASEQYFTFIRS